MVASREATDAHAFRAGLHENIVQELHGLLAQEVAGEIHAFQVREALQAVEKHGEVVVSEAVARQRKCFDALSAFCELRAG